MSNINFTEKGWIDYLYWINQDKKTLKRINQLIKDIERNGNSGIGKPEALAENFSGYWSRRIDGKNRCIYRILADGSIEVNALRTHYGDK
ncbi:txe/YoeB family addiction module toxin [Spirochaetia bacterium]|nr:txe/YoeB family addiction module toxin [Spirochaetia bacterium]GHU72869.1 txe/YoeB family addiction module toxin [Spirochaetia bacterium]